MCGRCGYLGYGGFTVLFTMERLTMTKRKCAVAWVISHVALGCSSSQPVDVQDDPQGGLLFGDAVESDLAADQGDGAFDETLACAVETAGAEASPAVLELVVDTSGSMDQRAPGARGSK